MCLLHGSHHHQAMIPQDGFVNKAWGAEESAPYATGLNARHSRERMDASAALVQVM